MHSKILYSLPSLVALLAGPPSPTHAAVFVTLPTESTLGSVEITEDIHFRIILSSTMGYIVLDEWVTSDGTLTGLRFNPKVDAPNLVYQLNGGPVLTTPILFGALYDNNASIRGPLTPNDGAVGANDVLFVASGDVLTLKPQTWVLPMGSYPDANPQAAQTFRGTAFLMTAFGEVLSAPVTVPESANTAFFTGIALLAGALHLRRRRKN